METTCLLNRAPYYQTAMGAAYLGDSAELMGEIPDSSIDLICTSPPFALLRQKGYGNVASAKYIEWFEPFAQQFARVLKPEGSLVIDIGGTWMKGEPVRSLYHFEFLIHICRPVEEGGLGFHLAQELYWYNPAKLPTPAQWVTIERVRVKDAVNTVWWLSRSTRPKASNRRVLRAYSESQRQLMANGYKAKLRPSEHQISTEFGKDNGGSIPPNLLLDTESPTGFGAPVRPGEVQESLAYDDSEVIPVNLISAANTSSNDRYQRMCRETGIKPHPARFPAALPEFVINLCSEPGDVVLDPFAGSNTTGEVAERLGRRWIGIDESEEYLKGSQFRFGGDEDAEPSGDGLVGKTLPIFGSTP